METAGLKVKEHGRLFLTTVRICFVADKPTASFASLDIPLQGISEVWTSHHLRAVQSAFRCSPPSSTACTCVSLQEEFCQPIFGANYLKGVVAPVPGRGMTGPTKFKLYFYKGGCQTFLNFFFQIMEKYKIADASARHAFFDSQRAVQSFISDMSAYVDPSDPTTIFIVQPAAAEAGGSASPYGAPPGYSSTTAGVSTGGGGGGGYSGGGGGYAPVSYPPTATYAPAPTSYPAPAPMYAPPGPIPAGSGGGYGYGYAAPPPPPGTAYAVPLDAPAAGGGAARPVYVGATTALTAARMF